MKIFFYLLSVVYLFFPHKSLWALKECSNSPLTTSFEKIPSNWDNCKGIFINTNKGYEGDKYVGEFKAGKMHGQGTHTWANGDKYVGQHKDGFSHGQGTMIWINGNKYIGEHKNDLANGMGTFIWSTGDKYVGEMKNDLMNGYGTIIWSTGAKYIGQQEDGKMIGQGTHIWPSGNRYVGEWNNDKPNGQGTFYWAEGEKYVGRHKDGKMYGQGTYFFNDGRVYDGQWKNSEFVDGKKYKKGEYKGPVKADTVCEDSPLETDYNSVPKSWNNCRGIFISTNKGHEGDKYIGQFKNGNRHGYGVYYYLADNKNKGDKYVGQYKNDRKHGHGTYIWADGEKYVGESKDNEMHGYGTFFFANGDKYIGEHQNNQRTGHGTFIWSAGDRYVGEYKDSKRHGEGTYFFKDGRVYDGQWKNSEFLDGEKYKEGEYKGPVLADAKCPNSPLETDYNSLPNSWHNCQGILIFKDKKNKGDRYEGNFKNTIMHGNGTYYFLADNEHKGDKFVGEWKDGEIHEGTYTWSNENKYIGEFLNNNRHGQGTFYWAEGEKYSGEWKEDIPNGQGTYTWKNGEKYVGENKDGVAHGHGTHFFLDGRVWDGQWNNDNWVSGEQYNEGEYKGPLLTHNNEQLQENKKESIIKEKHKREQLEKELLEIKKNNAIIPASSGSGFNVTKSGHIVTNYHVVNGCESVKIHREGNTYDTSIVNIDSFNDLAILKANFSPSTVFPISNKNAELMQDIFVAGYPFGLSISSNVKVTRGIVSSLAGLGNNFSNMQIDAALQPGNSGGPILDNKGNVIGVAVSKLDLALTVEEFGVVPEGTNFGIKSSVLKNFLESNNIKIKEGSDEEISRSELSKSIADGTIFLSCWMTQEQIKKLKSQKVMFKDIINN